MGSEGFEEEQFHTKIIPHHNNSTPQFHSATIFNGSHPHSLFTSLSLFHSVSPPVEERMRRLPIFRRRHAPPSRRWPRQRRRPSHSPPTVGAPLPPPSPFHRRPSSPPFCRHPSLPLRVITTGVERDSAELTSVE